MRKPLLPYVLAARKVSCEEFVARFPEAVLVIEPFVGLGDTGFRTVQAPSGAMGSTYSVAPVMKRSGSNTFSYMVTIGRAANNDIEIKAPGVSKFHAYILPSQDGAPDEITDAGSSFSTLVNGVKLEPRQSTPLEPGATLQLANVTARYFTAAAFHGFLREQASQLEEAGSQ